MILGFEMFNCRTSEIEMIGVDLERANQVCGHTFLFKNF